MTFFTNQDFVELPPKIASSPDGFDNLKADFQKHMDRGLEAVEQSKRVHGRLKDMQANISGLESAKQRAQDEVQRVKTEAFQEAGENPAFDNAGAAERIAKLQRDVSYFAEAIDFLRRREISLRLLANLEADANLVASQATVASYRAMISATERYIAAQPLVAIEGIAEFTPNAGRTGVLIAEAQQALRLAEQARQSITDERRRQMELNVGIALIGAEAK